MQNDWEDVTVLRKKQPKAAQMKSQQAINKAMRTGAPVETSKKFAAGSNKQFSAIKDTAKLDRETEELSHAKVGLSVAKAIQQGRQAKEMTQKDLATRVNEKPQVVNDYESGRAIPNQQILSKLERCLGIKLRGKDIGNPLGPKSKK